MSGASTPPVSALADVAALVGEDGWLTPPLRPMVLDVAPVVGRVRTVSIAVADDGPGMAPIFDVLSEDLTGAVLVLAGAPGLGGAVFGEILAVAARQQGAVGVVVDGWVRDRRELIRIGLPVHGRGERAVGPTGRAHVVAVDEAVGIDGMRIAPGDTMVLDSGGCMRLAASRAAGLLDAARRYAEAEERVVADVRSGVPLRDAYRHVQAAVTAIRDGHAPDAEEVTTGAHVAP